MFFPKIITAHRPLRALLIMAVVGIAYGFCFETAAENGAVAPGDSQVFSADDSYLADEAKWRLEKLPDDFKFKEVFRAVDKSAQFELSVPWSDDENRDSPSERMISLWFETAHGTFAMELLDPDRQLMVSWQGGRRSEQSLVRNLVPGKKYVVKLQVIDGARVYGVIGIKALYPGRCQIEGLTEYPPDPAHGYSWPYLLVTPSSPVAGAPRLPGDRRTLLVVPNNTGSATDDLEVMRAMAKCALTSPSDIDAIEIARRLGTPMSPILVPLFPRPDLKEIASNLQLQALTRASLEDFLPERLSRVDEQLIAMIDAAREKLAAEGRPVRRRVLMAGFSAAGQFTNRFTVLHPELVLAAAVGAPGSWPVAPVAADQGAKLRYPVGIADVKELTRLSVDLAALQRVPSLYFRGNLDDNDTLEHPDNYADRDSKLIERLFGNSILARWSSAKQLYHAAGLRGAQFKLYKGVKHEVTPDIRNDIIDMFRAALGAR
jgi:dienelactone hydrolase